MKAVPFADAQENFVEVMNAACNDREPIMITRETGAPVVVMALEEYEAMQETNYLRRSPANAVRLQEAINQLESGRGVERELPELQSTNGAI